jgi:hypothetical protein
LVTCLQLSFEEKVTKRNIIAIGIALTASKIAKPTRTRTRRSDNNQILSRVLGRIVDVVNYCSCGEATIVKVADKLKSILYDYQTPRDIQIQQMKQPGGEDFERPLDDEQLGDDTIDRGPAEEQPGGEDHQIQLGGEDLEIFQADEQFGGGNIEKVVVEEQLGDANIERQLDEVDLESLRPDEQLGGDVAVRVANRTREAA